MYCFPMHHVSDVMIFYLNVFRSIVKHKVLREHHTNLVITMNNGRIHLMIKSISQELAKPHFFTEYHTQCYILRFCGTQGHRVMFPIAPGNHGRPQGKTTIRCSPSIHCAPYPICIGISMQTQVYTRGISQAISKCALYISQYMLCYYPVSLS
jgi:hypothetical protein